MGKKDILLLFLILVSCFKTFANLPKSTINGVVRSADGNPIEFVVVYVERSKLSTLTNDKGNYSLSLPPGEYKLRFSHLNYDKLECVVSLSEKETKKQDVVLNENAETNLREVEIVGKSTVQQIRETPFNVVALDAKLQYNSTANLSDMLNRASGVRIRETGGVGSDMQLMLDGFSGKHIKIFIDGVPQEGVGASFGLNNIPVNFAERIEIYKGVVPVGFGTDAIGGIVNIVTKKNKKRWNFDASYSYGSFNTHKSYANFGQTFENGLIYEINAFQNYSDNNYYIDTPVKEFLPDGGSSTSKSKIEHVKRFHDTYHNETLIAKFGITDKKWADRLMFGVTFSQVYKEIQNGVRQEIVFGGKYREGSAIMPSLDYRKKDFLTKGLDMSLTANYNRNISQNVDTSTYEFNWRGEQRLRSSPGEQSYQHTRSDNNNWNGTFTANYNINKEHKFTFNNVTSAFNRRNSSLLTATPDVNPILKETQKNISGLSYQFMPSDRWNLSAFGKHYYQFVAGPVATTSNQEKYVRSTKTISTTGYGIVGTYFLFKNLQAKFSYEKVYRLPTNDEMFGDEDLESGDMSLRPENSDNLNLNLSINESFGEHSIYVEGGLVYRDIKDYIRRNIEGVGGGRYGATYINHGKVLTKGLNLTARYNYSNWLSLGGSFTNMSARDNVKTFVSGAPNLTYGARMPNIPYLFANSDLNLYWHNLGKKGNTLTASYDNIYTKGFPLYSEALGSESAYIVPTQFSHNISFSYALQNGRYNLTLECLNITDAKLYDNFSLQKPGRALYAKIRISLGN